MPLQCPKMLLVLIAFFLIHSSKLRIGRREYRTHLENDTLNYTPGE